MLGDVYKRQIIIIIIMIMMLMMIIIIIIRNTDYGVGHYHPSQGNCHHKEEETVRTQILMMMVVVVMMMVVMMMVMMMVMVFIEKRLIRIFNKVASLTRVRHVASKNEADLKRAVHNAGPVKINMINN